MTYPVRMDEPPVEFERYSAIESALAVLTDTLTKKNSDYKIDSNEFSNFYFAADVAGLNAQDVMLAQIGIKIGRIKGLINKTNGDINYEALLDTYQDLAGYAVLLYALKLKEVL